MIAFIREGPQSSFRDGKKKKIKERTDFEKRTPLESDAVQKVPMIFLQGTNRIMTWCPFCLSEGSGLVFKKMQTLVVAIGRKKRKSPVS